MAEEKDTKQPAKEIKEEQKNEIKNEIAEEQKKEQNTKQEKQEEKNIPDLKPGMTVRVYQKIKEINANGEEKERVQFFEGIIIAMKHGKEAGGSITVRKISNGVGVEKIFPLNLPTIDKIEIKKESKVRRAKLYFLKRGYKKRLKEIKK